MGSCLIGRYMGLMGKAAIFCCRTVHGYVHTPSVTKNQASS